MVVFESILINRLKIDLQFFWVFPAAFVTAVDSEAAAEVS